MKHPNPNVLICVLLFVLYLKSQDCLSINTAGLGGTKPVCLLDHKTKEQGVLYAHHTNEQGGEMEPNKGLDTYSIVENQKKGLLMISTINASISLLLFCILCYTVHQKRIKPFRKEEPEDPKRINPRSESFYELVELPKTDMSRFLMKFQEVYSDFIDNFTKEHSDLTSTELLLCAMIFLDFTSKEIAQYTFIAHTSVHKRKNRLRKKLKVGPYTNLYQYIKSYK